MITARNILLQKVTGSSQTSLIVYAHSSITYVGISFFELNVGLGRKKISNGGLTVSLELFRHNIFMVYGFTNLSIKSSQCKVS